MAQQTPVSDRYNLSLIERTLDHAILADYKRRFPDPSTFIGDFEQALTTALSIEHSNQEEAHKIIAYNIINQFNNYNIKVTVNDTEDHKKKLTIEKPTIEKPTSNKRKSEYLTHENDNRGGSHIIKKNKMLGGAICETHPIIQLMIKTISVGAIGYCAANMSVYIISLFLSFLPYLQGVVKIELVTFIMESVMFGAENFLKGLTTTGVSLVQAIPKTLSFLANFVVNRPEVVAQAALATGVAAAASAYADIGPLSAESFATARLQAEARRIRPNQPSHLEALQIATSRSINDKVVPGIVSFIGNAQLYIPQQLTTIHGYNVYILCFMLDELVDSYRLIMRTPGKSFCDEYFRRKCAALYNNGYMDSG